MNSIVLKIARRYAARCWWAELADLVQEGWLAALRAQHTWKPEGGAPLQVYVSRAVALSLGDYLWRQSSPVSGRRGHGSRMRGLHRASVEHAAVIAAVDDGIDMEADQWWTELRTYLEGVVQKHVRFGDVSMTLLDGMSAEKAASKMLVKGTRARKVTPPSLVRAVRRRTNAARKELRSDPWLREFVERRHAAEEGY